MYKIIFIIIITITVPACTSVYTKTIDAYIKVASTVRLGDSKASVMEKLTPTQTNLSHLDVKHPEQFRNNDKLVEIIFYRSGWQDDGITTDDEFTPYVFEDGVLKAIGWTVLGGAKTQAQSRTKFIIDRTYTPYPYRYYPRY